MRIKNFVWVLRALLMYLWLPLIFDVLIMFILSRMNVEETNVKIKKEKEMGLW